ncbi:MAG: carbonic anhydrase [Armatimonadota bacterium]
MNIPNDKLDIPTLRAMRTWDVLAISCFDGRFIPRTVEWLRQEAGVFDYRTEPGSSKAIIDSLPDLYRIVNVVETALRFHEITEVWLIDHADCMACGGSGIHQSAEAELDFHKRQLNQAKQALQRMCPGLEFKTAYIDWESAFFL